MKIAAAFTTCVVLAGCGDAGCADTLVTSAAAPDGRHRAVLFERDCGATTGFSSQVSLLGGQDRLNGAGNVFIGDDGHGVAPAARWGGPWVGLNWLSPTRLLITYDGRTRVFRRQGRVDGIDVSFRAVGPNLVRAGR